MKIVFIQPTGDKFGHYGVYFSKLPQELALKGHNITVYTNNLNPHEFLKSPPKFKIIKAIHGYLKFRRVDENKIKNPVWYWFRYFFNSFVVTFLGLIWSRRDQAEIIYISDSEFFMASIALWLVPSKANVIMQVNASNFSYDEYPGGKIKKIYKAFQAKFFAYTAKRKISAFSVLGEWHVERLREQLSLPSNYFIKVIPDGGGNEDISLVSKSDARNYLNLNQSDKVFLFNGILRSDKGLEILADSIRSVLPKFNNVTFLIAGQPFDYSKKALEDLFKVDTVYKDRLRLIFEYIEEDKLPYYFGAADCLLLPYSSKYKGSTGPLMKAACTYNLPVIVSDVANMGLLTRKHNLGYVVKTECIDSLTSNILSFSNLKDTELDVIKENTANFGNKNSWSAMADRYILLFKNLKNGDKYECNNR